MNVSIVILAAGLGTRMKSKHAKVLHRAGGKALVEHVVDAALEIADPSNVVVITGHQAERVEELLGARKIRFARQTEQLGTGHAVLMAKPLLENQPGLVVVLYGDTPLLTAGTIRSLLDAHAASARAATLIATELDDPTGYGRVLLNAAGGVTGIVEQKAATPEQLKIRLANSGIYAFEAPLLWKHLSAITPNAASGEIYLTDMAEILDRAGHTVRPFQIKDPSELFGINTRIELSQADALLRERKVRELMLAGVTIEQPETVTIDSQVRVGMDSIIGPFVQLRGATTLGADCIVGACSILTNATLADGVTVEAFTLIADSEVGAGAGIGPYARLRMNTEIGAKAKIGNFVELKKTKFGMEAKAQHLAYLGDSDIGEKTNIGAGTITCNYDGTAKHKTKIGSGAFIGSNSTLVAPIEIADRAYIAAGSVITDPVPADALALGRGRQVIKEGWAKKKATAKEK